MELFYQKSLKISVCNLFEPIKQALFSTFLLIFLELPGYFFVKL